MGKRLTTQTKLKRARESGYSRRDLARMFGVSVSTVGRAERGDKAAGASIAEAASAFYKGGKTQRKMYASGAVALPGAKEPVKRAPKAEAPPPAPEIFDPFEEAEKKLARFGNATRVVVTVNYMDGASRVFYARGGIEAGKIKGRLRGALSEQAQKQGTQGNRASISDPFVDMPEEIESIEIERY